MNHHLAKLLDAIWYLAMGLFLGLTGGLVLSVILTFRGAREIDASPGAEPFSDPKFADYHNDAVAGYIGQDLFMVGGTFALTLLAIAIVVRVASGLLRRIGHAPQYGSRLCGVLQIITLTVCVLSMVMGASITNDMNAAWPELYDTTASEQQITDRRTEFEYMHQLSERVVSTAWLFGLTALLISPWCRRYTDSPLQSGDGKEESH